MKFPAAVAGVIDPGYNVAAASGSNFRQMLYTSPVSW
jgi:hypothetical protein